MRVLRIGIVAVFGLSFALSYVQCERHAPATRMLTISDARNVRGGLPTPQCFVDGTRACTSNNALCTSGLCHPNPLSVPVCRQSYGIITNPNRYEHTERASAGGFEEVITGNYVCQYTRSCDPSCTPYFGSWICNWNPFASNSPYGSVFKTTSVSPGCGSGL